MIRWLLLFALVIPCRAQYTLGNFGTPVRTTQPYAQGNATNCSSLVGGIETITPNTPVTGEATMVTATAWIGGSCTGNPFTIAFTRTDWDGTTYVPVSHSGTTVVFTASQTDSYNSAVTGEYDANADLLRDSSGTIWNFFRCCAVSETSVSSVAIRSSTNGGATWNPPAGNNTIFTDPGTSCAGVQCAYSNQEVSYIGGNLAIIYDVFKPGASPVRQNALASICNPSTSNCLTSGGWSTAFSLPVPSGESPNFPCAPYGVMASLPGGAVAAQVTMCNSSGACCGNTYLYISCDSGATYGTGTGCVGLMAGYSSQPIREVIQASGGYTTIPPNNESAFAYIGGTTIFGLSRNNQFTSTCTTPCGQFIQWVSTDLGLTWVNSLTNIGDYPPPTGQAAKNYTEVSPVIYNPSLGGYWIITWGDRGQDSANTNYTQSLAFYVNPANVISAPTAYPTVPTQIDYEPGLVLGGYPAITNTGTGNQFLLQYDASGPRLPGVLAIWQLTANPGISNAFVFKGKAAKGVAMQ